MRDNRIGPGRALLAAAALTLLAVFVARAEGEVTAFVGATVIDGSGAAPLPEATVLVVGERIVAVAPRQALELPARARIVEVGGKWIIPGLVDAHIHLFQSGGAYTRPDIIDLRAHRPYAEEVARVKARIELTLARYLASGITAVVDVGGPLWNFEVRARAARAPLAPRVAVAGPLLATYAPPALAGADPPIVRIATPDEARAEVRRQLLHDPDLIKIWFVFPARELGPEIAWVRAAVAESHAGGVRVVAHATQRRVARAVIEAGVDVLAHSIDDGPVDDRLLALMKARDVVYTTTIVVKEGYREVLGLEVRLSDIERRLGDPEAIASFRDLETLSRRLLAWWLRPRPPPPLHPPLDPVVGANLARVWARGITVAAGSDAGNIGTLHGPALHRELELMVAAGLTPAAVLVAATRGGARVMGRDGDHGTLAPGKLADMVILDADPLADIRNTRRIHLVVKGGRVLDPDEIMARARAAHAAR
ncbi:MAG: amidohydrolase family protein [Alphaproteobacteria bacterium]